MKKKFFKKTYSDRVGYGKWKEGDSVNYMDDPDGKYTIKEITEGAYNSGIKNLVIPKTREGIIQERIEKTAIDSLIADGSFDSNGEPI